MISPEIQQYVQQEIQKAAAAQRFHLGPIPRHVHDGVDSLRVNQSDITPGVRASGSITFSSTQQYRLGITFNPTSVWFYGIAVHRTAGVIDIRAHVVGNAQLGPSYFFQPQTTSSVQPSKNIGNLIQSSSMLLIDSSTTPVTVRAIADEGNLVDVEYPTVVARATVNANFTSQAILIDVTVASGWSIVGNYVVT